jgi:hypothetical protein
MRLVKALYLGYNTETVKKNLAIWKQGKLRAKELDLTMSGYVLSLVAEDTARI